MLVSAQEVENGDGGFIKVKVMLSFLQIAGLSSDSVASGP
jgi:hypothetical protein